MNNEHRNTMTEAEILERNPLFNPKGDELVEHRTIIKGATTGLFNLNATKYPWAK